MHICPSCGGFEEYLDPKTGWCLTCSGIQTCTQCSRKFRSKTKRPRCWTCRREGWLLKHADEIEEFMLAGSTFEEATKLIEKPHCLGCGKLLPKIGYFCGTTEKCKKLKTKYRRLKTKKNYTTEEALREALKHET